MVVTDKQNIFDIGLQSYGTLDQIVKLASDNDLLLDEIPEAGKTLIVDETIGEKRVKVFVTENTFVYTNEAIEKTAILLAAEDIALSPEIDIQFIYK